MRHRSVIWYAQDSQLVIVWPGFDPESLAPEPTELSTYHSV